MPYDNDDDTPRYEGTLRTVADLIEHLSELDPDALVRVAEEGHRSSFEYDVAGIAQDYDDHDGERVVWIGQGRQLGYLSAGASGAFWRG